MQSADLRKLHHLSELWRLEPQLAALPEFERLAEQKKTARE
jgi:hypothetical protein